ncbi:MAG: efflux RND transporter permease subunit [bacterium]|nr:efflux RND transporter permease subunit [bacterium]
MRILLLLLWVSVAGLGAVAGRLFFWLTAPLSRLTDRLQRSYPGGLERALARRGWVIATAFLLLLASMGALPARLPGRLFQHRDGSRLREPSHARSCPGSDGSVCGASASSAARVFGRTIKGTGLV